jgi:type II secretory pathway component PulL
MIIDSLAVVVVMILLWLAQLLYRLYCEGKRTRTVQQLVAASEQIYATNPEMPGLKFSWVMHRLKDRYPKVDYEQLTEEIQAAQWEVGTYEKFGRIEQTRTGSYAVGASGHE